MASDGGLWITLIRVRKGIKYNNMLGTQWNIKKYLLDEWRNAWMTMEKECFEGRWEESSRESSTQKCILLPSTVLWVCKYLPSVQMLLHRSFVSGKKHRMVTKEIFLCQNYIMYALARFWNCVHSCIHSA